MSDVLGHPAIPPDASDSLAVLEKSRSTAETFGIPLAVLLEITHRCPLQCPYCSNPVELDRSGKELTTEEWKKVLSELAEIGVLQVHFSGGEPTARKDLVALVRHANDAGLYTNLITSAVLLTREKLSDLADAGLCHVQISFQGIEEGLADRVAGYKGGHRKKLEVAKWTRELDLPLTVNAVMHRQNLHQLPDIIQMAVDLDADRLARAAQGPADDRLRRSRLLRAAAEEMHGRLGPAVLQHLACRQGAALPCGREHHRARLRVGAFQPFDRLDLAELRGIQPLSRHRLDEGAVQELRIPRDRFRRLPLPGLRADG
jgi:pyruvate-formate lyase-activating enzyme